MRKDMAKVVTERERRGSSATNRKSKLKILPKKLDEDNDLPGPKRLSMSMTAKGLDWEDHKEFTDVLGPIEGWLRKQARKRRPWSKVYSELREVLPDKASQPIRHIWEAHVEWMIKQHCRLGVNGKVYSLHHIYPRNEWREVENTFYVHPKTGLFLWAPKKVKKVKKDPDYITKYNGKADDKGNITLTLGENSFIVRRGGIWYFLSYEQREYIDPITKTRHVITTPNSKQLNKKELKQYGLANKREEI